MKLFSKTISVVFVLFCVFYVSIIGLPPSSFVPETEVVFEKGESVGELAYKLESKNIIKSPVLFKIIMKLSGKETSVQSGTYVFRNPETVLHVAGRFIYSNYGVSTVKMVVPEGSTTNEISEICKKVLKNCNEENFLKISENKNGMLFPDTYFFFETDDEYVVLEKMTENFDKKTKDIFSGMDESKIQEILVIASILESESNSGEERYVVSGIIQNRLKINMPLQIDAPFYVYLGKRSSDLTLSDLKIDEEWNTYVYPGLPKEPLGNPGLEAIDASINPTPSSYLYYLHDSEGNIYYGKTFEEHKQNKSLYLN